MGDDPSRGPMMTRVCWQLVEILSLMLHPDERQAVRAVSRGLRSISPEN